MSVGAAEFVHKRLTFSPEIVGWLEQKADEEGASRRCIFVAAVVALLARYAGREDVALEIQADGHTRRVQLRLDGEPDAWQLLGRTAIALAGAGRADPGNSTEPPPSESRAEQTTPG